MNLDSILQIDKGNYKHKAMPIQITKINNSENQEIIKKLLAFAKANKLQAVSAPILGINYRIIVFKIKNKYEVFVNPVIIDESKEKSNVRENCLAINHGKTYALVPRPNWIEISGLNKQGKRFSLKLKDKLAASFQHHRDHLEGKFFKYD